MQRKGFMGWVLDSFNDKLLAPCFLFYSSNHLVMLSGKNVIITGASGGIGSAICELLVKNGANLYITDRNDERLNSLKEKLLKINGSVKVFYSTCDLSDKGAIVNLVDTANKEMGGIDILVGNAGITADGLSIRMTDEQWQSVIDVNLTANFVLSRECAKIMMKRKFGRIINIASIVGLIGNAGQANYSASKAGLMAMTKTFAQEFATRGITANCIAPGFIETRMTQMLSEDVRKALIDKIPMKKYGEPVDIANAVLFLASDMGKYITGETISVNGGMLMA